MIGGCVCQVIVCSKQASLGAFSRKQPEAHDAHLNKEPEEKNIVHLFVIATCIVLKFILFPVIGSFQSQRVSSLPSCPPSSSTKRQDKITQDKLSPSTFGWIFNYSPPQTKMYLMVE